MKESVLVLGSGPIRIGQGIEFDYSCVHSVWALQEMGFRALIVNNNPETVSTDFDTGDGLYFEPLTLGDVQRVIQHEKPLGVVVQFGGQTAINLAENLAHYGVKILGTSHEAIAIAEDREKFERLLDKLGVPKPPGRAVKSVEDARIVAEEIGYPVIVRPSFVLGGRAMVIVYSSSELDAFYQLADEANPGKPVLIDKYLVGQEIEVDVISDGEDTLVPGIMEHIERAGVHSGDSMAVYPSICLSRELEMQVIDVACALAKELGIKGLMNIQFVFNEGKLYVIEVNPRASRTVPYLSKVSGIPMVQLATRCMMGETLASMAYGSGIWCAEPGDPPAKTGFSPRTKGRVISSTDYANSQIKQNTIFAVKAPVFSFQKLALVEPSLGPEMKSTGEVLGIDRTYEGAVYKALIASGIQFKSQKVALTLSHLDKEHTAEIGKQLADGGYEIYATEGTANELNKAGIDCHCVKKIQEGSPNFLDLIQQGELGLMINTPGSGARETDEARRIRRACIESGVACITSIDTARALTRSIQVFQNPELTECKPYTDYLRD